MGGDWEKSKDFFILGRSDLDLENTYVSFDEDPDGGSARTFSFRGEQAGMLAVAAQTDWFWAGRIDNSLFM